MEDDLVKSHTDCVYFLASPLTCRKGMECEFRHSETARLNPRDCWYWLAGSCFNPACAFRHPPLEGYTQASSEFTEVQPESASSMNKTKIPCYFYFNAFCYKGDKCSFMHGPDGSESAAKPTKSITGLPSVNKTSASKDIGLQRTATVTVPCATETELIPVVKMICKTKDPQQALVQSSKLSIPSQVLGSESDESLPLSSGSLPEAEGIALTINQPCADLFQMDEAVDPVHAEEQWESSTDLDVLVDDGSENLVSEDDPEDHLPAYDTKCTEHILGYDFDHEDNIEILNSESGLLYERDVISTYEHTDDGLVFEILEPENRLRERKSSSARNTLSPFRLPAGGQRHRMDLRYRLRRDRRFDNHRVRFSSRMNGSSRSPIGKTDKLRGHGKLCARLTYNMKRYADSHDDHSNLLHRGYRRHSLRHVEYYNSKQYHSEKRLPRRQPLPLEVSRKRTPKERKSVHQWSTTFSGPKTLAQIKEEKKKCEDNNYEMQHASEIRFTDFQGPKPLSELLKEKKRSEFIEDGTSSSRRSKEFR